MPKPLQSSNKTKSESAHKQKAAPLDWAGEVDLSFLESHVSTAPAFPVSHLSPSVEALVSGISAAQRLSPSFMAPVWRDNQGENPYCLTR
jgi:hypothetical protein